MELSLFSTLVISTLIGGFGGHGLIFLSERIADVMQKDKSIYVSLNHNN